MDENPIPSPEPEKPAEREQAVVLVRLTLRGNGETKPPTLPEIEGMVEGPFRELGWTANASAERVD